MDRRLWPGLAIGLAGLVLGVTAAMARPHDMLASLAGAGAGVCALAAALASIVSAHWTGTRNLRARQDGRRTVSGGRGRLGGGRLGGGRLGGGRLGGGRLGGDRLGRFRLGRFRLSRRPPSAPATPVEARGAVPAAAALVDSDTGLPGNGYFTVALHERLATARRHLWPLTLVLVDIGISPPVDPHGEAMAAASFARLVRETLREADVACRLAGTRFALVLEDTAEEGGVWTAERLQVGLSRQSGRIRRLSAGVASYPTHAMDGDEILAQAGAALDRACAAEAGRGLGPVEVAKLELN